MANHLMNMYEMGEFLRLYDLSNGVQPIAIPARLASTVTETVSGTTGGQVGAMMVGDSRLVSPYHGSSYVDYKNYGGWSGGWSIEYPSPYPSAPAPYAAPLTAEPLQIGGSDPLELHPLEESTGRPRRMSAVEEIGRFIDEMTRGRSTPFVELREEEAKEAQPEEVQFPVYEPGVAGRRAIRFENAAA